MAIEVISNKSLTHIISGCLLILMIYSTLILAFAQDTDPSRTIYYDKAKDQEDTLSSKYQPKLWTRDNYKSIGNSDTTPRVCVDIIKDPEDFLYTQEECARVLGRITRECECTFKEFKPPGYLKAADPKAGQSKTTFQTEHLSCDKCTLIES